MLGYLLFTLCYDQSGKGEHAVQGERDKRGEAEAYTDSGGKEGNERTYTASDAREARSAEVELLLARILDKSGNKTVCAVA